MLMLCASIQNREISAARPIAPTLRRTALLPPRHLEKFHLGSFLAGPHLGPAVTAASLRRSSTRGVCHARTLPFARNGRELWGTLNSVAFGQRVRQKAAPPRATPRAQSPAQA
jgi:hypothetical protein